MADTTRILWLSQHKVQQNQKEELQQIFGDYKLVKINQTISSADDIVNLMEKHNCNEVMPVVPQAIRRELVNDLGVRPLYAETMKVSREGPPVYKHLKFYFIKAEQELINPSAQMAS